MKLTEAVDIKPDERERLGLPSYLSTILPKAQALANTDLPPVEVKEEKWEVVEKNGTKRLTRAFKFEDPRIKATFLLELIDYEEQIHHHGKITMFEDRIKIEVWTRDIDDVTEIDLDYANEVDMIVDDVYYQFRE